MLADPPARADQLVLPLGLTLDEVAIATVLASSGGKKTEAAHRLGVGRSTVARAIQSETPALSSPVRVHLTL